MDTKVSVDVNQLNVLTHEGNGAGCGPLPPVVHHYLFGLGHTEKQMVCSVPPHKVANQVPVLLFLSILDPTTTKLLEFFLKVSSEDNRVGKDVWENLGKSGDKEVEEIGEAIVLKLSKNKSSSSALSRLPTIDIHFALKPVICFMLAHTSFA